MIGKNAHPVEVASWINSAPLGSVPAQGKVRILDFWGTESAPCLAAMPKLQTFWQAHQTDPLELIALTGPLPDEEFKDFLAQHSSDTFPVANRAEGSHTKRDYYVRGIPTYVVIDKSGKIIYHGRDWSAASQAALEALWK
jgi:thiol-disulfide isomerase/thioredoxin